MQQQSNNERRRYNNNYNINQGTLAVGQGPRTTHRRVFHGAAVVSNHCCLVQFSTDEADGRPPIVLGRMLCAYYVSLRIHISLSVRKYFVFSNIYGDFGI